VFGTEERESNVATNTAMIPSENAFGEAFCIVSVVSVVSCEPFPACLPESCPNLKRRVVTVVTNEVKINRTTTFIVAGYCYIMY